LRVLCFLCAQATKQPEHDKSKVWHDFCFISFSCNWHLGIAAVDIEQLNANTQILSYRQSSWGVNMISTASIQEQGYSDEVTQSLEAVSLL